MICHGQVRMIINVNLTPSWAIHSSQGIVYTLCLAVKKTGKKTFMKRVVKKPVPVASLPVVLPAFVTVLPSDAAVHSLCLCLVVPVLCFVELVNYLQEQQPESPENAEARKMATFHNNIFNKTNYS